MNPRITHLKIKIHTLADEARHIRREERKALAAGRKGRSLGRHDYEPHYRAYESLHEHRTGIVRDAARSCHLAYGYLRGTPYRAMEAAPNSEPDWRKIEKLIVRFGGDLTNFKAWRQGKEVARVA